MTAPARPCPQCGTALPRDAPKGLCPECLLRGGFEDGDVAASAAPPQGTIHIVVPMDEPAGGVPENLRRFGDYELLEEIAVGGMGVVFKARQLSLNRLVAVKMIRAGGMAREPDLRRFRTEAEAAATLRHPHIVAIHEVGEFEGRPYFSMDFIEGRSLAELVRDHPLEPARAARLVRTIAEAIAYAHNRGVLHRDLKPSNVMMDAQDQPHVTDFGLAKLLKGDSELTHTGAVLGSPSYMSPEQARGRADQVGVRSDVYALGAMLYELLTGHPPFLAATALETLKLVADREPVAPRALNQAVPRDLETISLKCLQKDPGDRYAGAQDLADELGRFLRDEPIQARPAGGLERACRWCRRKPAVASLVGLSFAAPLAFALLVLAKNGEVRRQAARATAHEHKATNALARAEAETRRADDAATKARQNLYAADMLLAQHALDDGNLRLARRLLEAQRPRPGETDLRGFEWRLLWQRSRGDEFATLRGHSNGVHVVAYSSDGKRLASGDGAGRVRIWDSASRSEFATLAASSQAIERISFSGDDEHLSTADAKGAVHIWELKTGRSVWTHQGRNPIGVQLSSSRPWIGVTDGSMARNTTNMFARVVDWTTRLELLRVGPGVDFDRFSPDGRLAYCTRPRPLGGTEVWDVEARRKVQTIPDVNGEVFLSPDGRTMASMDSGGSKFALIRLAEPASPHWIQLNGSNLRDMAFSPDGTLLAGAGVDQSVHVWDVATRQELSRRLGHVDSVMGVAFSPDGRHIATASLDQSVKLWEVRPAGPSGPDLNGSLPFVLSPDGRKLACFDNAERWQRLVLHDLVTRETLHLTQPGQGLAPAFFSADGRTLFACGETVTNSVLPFVRWDLAAPGQPPQCVLWRMQPVASTVKGMATADRQLFALFQTGTGISVRDLVTGESVGRLKDPSRIGAGHPRAFSSDGRKLASLLWPNGLRLSDWSTRETVCGVELPPDSLNGMAFSPDSQVLAVGCGDATIKLFDATSLREIGLLSGHQQAVQNVAFSSDGRTLASCGNGGVVKLWCWPARREVATPIHGGPDFDFVAFVPGDDALITGGWGTPLHIIRVPPLAEIDGAR